MRCKERKEGAGEREDWRRESVGGGGKRKSRKEEGKERDR